MSDRFVVLGLARSRERWFSELVRWSTSAVIPIEYIKCLTADEARAVIGSGRRLSAVLVDAGISRLDRELIALTTSIGAATLVVIDPTVHRDWDGLGCAATLPPGFGPDDLLEALTRHARPVDRSTRRTSSVSLSTGVDIAPCPLVGVAGPGGTGASTVAMALAQGVARTQPEPAVALADGARSADMAMYHDVGDVIPGLPELVEAHRTDQPDPDEIRRLLFSIEDRRYHLLLGQRRSKDAAAMRPRSIAAAIAGLRRSFDLVIVDHDADLDGEAETGSVDIEDRHSLSRTTATTADLIILVGRPGVKGVSDMIRLVDRYADLGVPRDRLVPVVNLAPRNPATRAMTTRTLAELTRPVDGSGTRCATPLFVRNVHGLEEVHRSAALLPDALTNPITRAVRRLLLEVGSRSTTDAAPGTRVRPGELATFDGGGRHLRPGVTHHRSDRSDVA